MAISLPDKSTLAGGLTGLLAWSTGMVLAHYGVVIPPETLTPIIIGLVTVVVHFVPDAAKVDATIKEVAAVIPQAYSDPKDFPNAPKPPSNVSNINKG